MNTENVSSSYSMGCYFSRNPCLLALLLPSAILSTNLSNFYFNIFWLGVLASLFCHTASLLPQPQDPQCRYLLVMDLQGNSQGLEKVSNIQIFSHECHINLIQQMLVMMSVPVDDR